MMTAGQPRGVRHPGARGIHRLGDRALLVQCSDLAEVLDLHALLDREPLPGQTDLLPAAETLLVRTADSGSADRLAAVLATLEPPPRVLRDQPEVTLDVVYDGEDRDDVARVLGCSVQALVAEHAARTWTAAFLGFAPGFAYLVGSGASLDIPRRATPRTAVPAGAVGLAGPYSAVYPRVSPGGWQIIGRTQARLWDPDRTEPALLRQGMRIRFRPTRAQVHGGIPAPGTPAPDIPAPDTPAPGTPAAGAGSAAPAERPATPQAEVVGPALTVVEPGMQSLVQDLGRPGLLGLAVTTSGALDRGAAVRANRLVGNPRGAAVVETVLGGLVLQARGRQVLAVTGAPAPLTVLGADGAPVAEAELGRPLALHDGQRLVLGTPAAGMRSYVAARGGLGPRPVLGSRSTDLLSGLGPAPLRAGDVLPVLGEAVEAVAAWAVPESAPPGAAVTVRTRPGPRLDRLDPAARRALHGTPWTVSDQSNRVGLRLTGEALALSGTDELPSEGTVAGAVQVPPSGLPVVFLADHPVTGGYPVVAAVREADLDLLAQLRPGDTVRLEAG